jgi:hypothetical protein
MGCAGFSAEDFSYALSWREKPEQAHAVEAIRKGGIVHGASLLQFLIVSNQLQSEPPSSMPSSPLILTLAVSIVTFTSGRTNRVEGVVHFTQFFIFKVHALFRGLCNLGFTHNPIT